MKINIIWTESNTIIFLSLSKEYSIMKVIIINIHKQKSIAHI